MHVHGHMRCGGSDCADGPVQQGDATYRTQRLRPKSSEGREASTFTSGEHDPSDFALQLPRG